MLWVGEVGLLVSRNVIFVLLGFFAMAPGMWGFAGYKRSLEGFVFAAAGTVLLSEVKRLLYTKRG